MNLSSRNKIIIIIIICFVILFSLLSIILNKNSSKKITLTMWGYNDSPQIMAPIIETFRQTHPNINIIYYQKEQNNYYNDLIQAYANNKAPDIFILPGNWLPLFENKIAYLNLENDKDYNLRSINETYPDAVIQELLQNNSLKGIPISLDTLALYYNKDIFKFNNINKPPQSWVDLYKLVPKLKKVNKQGQITQAAIALGASNVNWQTDILSELMIQLGSDIVDSSRQQFTIMNSIPNNFTGIKSFTIIPGTYAFDEYTQFANIKSPLYTWNNDLSDSSLKAFNQGKVAMILGYSEVHKSIEQQAPDLNYGISIFPIINSPTHYAHTINLVVNNQSPYLNQCWQFLKFFASRDISEAYLNLSNNPPARLDLIEKSLNDPLLSIFASQALSSKSWYQFNYQIIDSAFDQIVTTLISNNQKSNDVLGEIINSLEKQWHQQMQK